MKYLSKRNHFLAEAKKIRDVILPKQAKEVGSYWGESWLDLEKITPTENIKQGVWKLDDFDKIEILSSFFQCDMKKIYDGFNSLPDHFKSTFEKSIDYDLIDSDKVKTILEKFDIQFPSVDGMSILFRPLFRKISVSETKSKEVIVRDESGMPVRDESGKILKRLKDKEEVIFTKNLVNIKQFASDYSSCFESTNIDDVFQSSDLDNLVNLASEDMSRGEYTVDYNVFSKDMYLKIKHYPKDILNMSISKFYSSCQHLYTGAYREKVLSNVFDPNTIPAFIIFDTPIYKGDELISEQLPLCRMMIRNIEKFDSTDSPEIFFDRCYPDRCKNAFNKIISKYTEIEPIRTPSRSYLFSPDIPENYRLGQPYMDKLNLETGRYIGVNTKQVVFTQGVDWSKVKVSKNAKLDSIVIQTENIPKAFYDLNMSTSFIIFRYMKIDKLDKFNKIKTDLLGFDKCYINNSIISSYDNKIKKLKLTNCEFDEIDFTGQEQIEELSLIFTIDGEKFQDLINNLLNVQKSESGKIALKKIILSSDLLTIPSNKSFLNKIKSYGVKIEIIGPKI